MRPSSIGTNARRPVRRSIRPFCTNCALILLIFCLVYYSWTVFVAPRGDSIRGSAAIDTRSSVAERVINENDNLVRDKEVPAGMTRGGGGEKSTEVPRFIEKPAFMMSRPPTVDENRVQPPPPSFQPEPPRARTGQRGSILTFSIPGERLGFGLHPMCNMALFLRENRRAYASRHGYDFHIETKPLENENGIRRSRSWAKINLAREACGTGDYAHVLVADADAFVANMDIRYESLLEGGNYDMVLGRSVNKPLTNVMVLRCTAWAIDFLERVWKSVQWVGEANEEATAIMHMMQLRAADAARVKQIPLRSIQSWVHGYGSSQDEYSPGDFMLHLAGVEEHKVQKIIESYHDVLGPVGGTVSNCSTLKPTQTPNRWSQMGGGGK